jgi:hypothetical protein
MRSSAYCIAMIFALLTACSTSGRIVPSRDSVDKIAALNRRSDVIVDVLTVDRTEHWLKLSGAGGAALSGRDAYQDSDSGGPAGQVIIPPDQLALVVYKIVSDKQWVSPMLLGDNYPSLPRPETRDRHLSCSELDLGVSRAATIRWSARSRGGEPFTAHGAQVQHVKNAAENAGSALALALVVSLGGQPREWTWAAPETLRWAITSADRREIGLLKIKRDLSCPAHSLPGSETTDLDVLNQIESTRMDLAARRISEQEQMDRQTKLLDQFDPPAAKCTGCEQIVVKQDLH